MKIRTLIIVFLGLLATLTVSAQQKKSLLPGHFSVKTCGGITLSKMFGNQSGSKLRFGFTGGVEGEYMLTENVSAAVGAYYSQQGGRGSFQFDDCDEELNMTLKFDYINVPILASFYITDDLALRVGLQPGYLISERLRISDAEKAEEDAIETNLKKFDIAVPVGILADFHHIVFELRYNVGAIKVDKKRDGTNGSLTNGVFQFTAGYRF